MLSASLKGVLDTLMVGFLGTDALAAVGVAGVMAFTALAFGMGVMRGQKSLVSQYEGAGQQQLSVSFGAHAFYLGILIGVLCIFMSRFAGPLFQLISQDSALNAESVRMGEQYLGLRIAWGSPLILSLSLAEYFRARGRSRLPMFTDLISHPLNFLFNYMLIFGHWGAPELGVEGAAIGTGLADTASFVLLLIIPLLRQGRPPSAEPFRLRFSRLWRTLEVGSASGIQFTLEVGSFTLVTLMISRFLGSLSTAAHQAALQFIHFSFLPAVAIADGGAVLIGRYVGMKRLDLVQNTVRNMTRLILPLMLTMGVIFVVFGKWLMTPFIHHEDPQIESETIALAASVMAVAGLWQFGDAFQILYRFSLRAAGDHRWVMWVGILCSWVLSVPLAYIAMVYMKGNVPTVWLMWSAELYVGAWIFRRRWKSGVWHRKRLVREEEPPMSNSLMTPME